MGEESYWEDLQDKNIIEDLLEAKKRFEEMPVGHSRIKAWMQKLWKSKGLRPEEYEAHKTVMDALCSGYVLCNVDEAVEKIKQKAWKEDSIEVEDCIDILKEGCL